MSKEKANDRINSRIAPAAAAKKSHSRIIIAVAGIIICVLVGVILYMLVGKDSKAYNTVVTPDNVEEVIAELDEAEHTPVGSYEVVMNTDWVFPDSSSASSNAYVENSVDNQNTVYFTIALANGTTPIYESPLIPVGSHLEDIKLDTKLDAGTYDAVMTYHLVDDDNKEISSVSVSMKITIDK